MTRFHALIVGKLDRDLSNSITSSLFYQFPELRTRKISEIHLDFSESSGIDKDGIDLLKLLHNSCNKLIVLNTTKTIRSSLKSKKVDTLVVFLS